MLAIQSSFNTLATAATTGTGVDSVLCSSNCRSAKTCQHPVSHAVEMHSVLSEGAAGATKKQALEQTRRTMSCTSLYTVCSREYLGRSSCAYREPHSNGRMRRRLSQPPPQRKKGVVGVRHLPGTTPQGALSHARLSLGKNTPQSNPPPACAPTAPTRPQALPLISVKRLPWLRSTRRGVSWCGYVVGS